MTLGLDDLLRALASERVDGVGAREWSLFANQGRRFSLGIKDREIGNPHAPLVLAESAGARYRIVWDDGLFSRGYLERQQVEGDLRETLLHARSAAYEDPDSAWVAGPAEFPEVEIHDPAAAAAAAGDTALLERRLAEVRRRVESCRTWSGSFSASEGQSRVVSSTGLDASSRGTTVSWFVSVNGEIGNGFSARKAETHEEFERRLEITLEIAEHLGAPAAELSGGTHPVILDPGVVEDYVVGTLFENLGGSTVSNGEGHFRREQFGTDEPVVREDLGLRIDPLVPMKSGSYRFTTEGVPAAPCRFLDRGRLVQPMLDLKYARRLGLPPTPLPLASDTVHLSGPPALTLDEALHQADGGVLVLSVLGVHTQDGASGDFSLSAPQALAIRSGGFGGRLRGTISGNIFSVLSRDDLRFVSFEGETTPGLLFPCRFDPS